MRLTSAYMFAIEHICYGQLTAVKTSYSLTSMNLWAQGRTHPAQNISCFIARVYTFSTLHCLLKIKEMYSVFTNNSLTSLATTTNGSNQKRLKNMTTPLNVASIKRFTCRLSFHFYRVGQTFCNVTFHSRLIEEKIWIKRISEKNSYMVLNENSWQMGKTTLHRRIYWHLLWDIISELGPFKTNPEVLHLGLRVI